MLGEFQVDAARFIEVAAISMRILKTHMRAILETANQHVRLSGRPATTDEGTILVRLLE